ncbi:MAG: sulfurtransferase [Candidatus Sericytochromatia bacterium]
MGNLIQAETLQTLLQQPQTARPVVIDVRFSLQDAQWGEQAYAAGHLPGAVYLDLNRDLSGPVAPHGGRHPFPDAEQLRQTLASCGISDASQVVAYDDAGGMFAVRLWALLRWLGHDAVQVLDGGLQAWEAAGLPLSQDLPSPTPGTLSLHLRPEWLIERSEIVARSGELNLVDARSAERYRGENESLDPRAGHIPGARNRPFADNLTAGRFKSARELERDFQALGLHKQSEIVVYCGSGVTANHTLLALEEANYLNTRLYVGSWSDWVSYPDSPVASGEAPGTLQPPFSLAP